MEQVIESLILDIDDRAIRYEELSQEPVANANPSDREAPEEVSHVSAVPSPASTTEALRMLRAAMEFLNAADATAMVTEEQAQCLQALEQANSMGTAVRASILRRVR
jgi:hypothetical protein